MALFKKNKAKKNQSIEQLITEFTSEKDKGKKLSLCNTILSCLDQNAPIKTVSDLLIKTISFYEKSTNSDEITVWTKIMMELARLVPNYKLTYQNRILNSISSNLFNDDPFKLAFINALTENGKEIMGIPNEILSSFIEFIIFNNILKEDNEEILNLLKDFIHKIGPINIEGYLINFIVDTLCLLAYNYNINLFCIDNKEKEEIDKTIKKLLICIQIIEACLDELQIIKKNVVNIVFFIVILFNFIDPSLAHSFYIKLVLQCGRLFENELIDLLFDKTVIKHLDHLDKMLLNDYMLFQFIFQFNGDKIKSVSNDYIIFQNKYKPNKDQLKEIIIITQLSTLRLIKELCWQNGLSKFGEFKIPHSIILHNMLELSGNTVYFIEIIENLDMFIHKYKNYNNDEWEYAFDIIDVLIRNLNTTPKELSTSFKSYQSAPITNTGFYLLENNSYFVSLSDIDNQFLPSLTVQKTKIEDLLKKIINLCIKKMNGNVNRIKSSLLLFTTLSDDYLLMWKIQFSLKNFEIFQENILSIIEGDVLQKKSNIVKIYIFDHIRNYYYNAYNKKQQALVIEKIIQSNHTKILNMHSSNEKILITYSSFIVYMLRLTCNNEFFFDIMTQLLNNSSLDSINKFQRQTLLSIINKLIRAYEKDKLSFCMGILNNQITFLQENAETLEQNTNLIKNIIYLFKHFYINEYDEIEVKLDNHRKRLLSFFITNYDEMKQLEKTSINKDKFGYLPLNLNDFYSFFLYIIEQKEENAFVFSEVLALFNKQLRHMFFFKHLDILKIVLIFYNQLLFPDYIAKYLNKEIIIKQITQLFINIVFHLNTDLLTQLPSEAQIDKQGYKTLLDIYDPHHSMKKNIINLIISVVSPMIALSNEFLVIENKQLITKSSKDEIITNRLSISDICSNGMPFDINIVFINQFIGLLETFLFSLIDWTPKERTSKTFFSTKNRDNVIEQQKTVIYGSIELVSSVNGFITILRKSKGFINFDYEFAFVLLKTIFVIKELLISFGEEKKIEVIYLILCIVWPGYEKELTEAFKNIYKFGFLNDTQVNTVNEKKENTEDKFKRMLLIEWFGDNVIMFFIEKIKTGNQLLNILQKVLNKPNDNRQTVFIELVKWNLIIQGNRDNLQRNNNNIITQKNKLNKMEAYYDGWNFITLNKIENETHKVTIRNALSNISFKIKSPPSIWKEEKDQMAKLRYLINKDSTKRTDNQNSSHLLNNKQQLNQRDYSYNTIFRTLSINNFTNNQIDLLSLPNEINQLDFLTVYTVISCGVIFYPDIHQITDYQLMMYNDKVSIPYLSFINSLGHTIEINDKNSNIFLMGQARNGKEGKYVIYHQDAMFQIIFHCSNLITSDKDRLGDVRKRILGNNYINIIWMDNCYMTFTPSTIKTKKTFIYIVIYPYSPSHYYVKLKFQALNNETDQLIKEKQNIIEMIKKFIQTKLVIYVDKNCYALSNYIKRVVIIATSLIEYNIEKMNYCNGKTDSNLGNIHRNTLLFRYQELSNHLGKNKE